MAQSSNTTVGSFETNKFYVPKNSTTPPVPQATSNPVPQHAPFANSASTRSPVKASPVKASPAKIIHSPISGFSIPFNVDADDDAFIEVHLYTSANQGATWEFLNRQPTTADEFPFQANGEGEYWFAIKTLDRNRRLLPLGDPQPELRIIVDTTLPKLEMTAAADPAGRIVCRWNASDLYLKPETLQLQYKPTFAGGPAAAVDTQWQSVTVNTPTYAPGGIYVDQLAFWPETNVQTLDVRIAIADQAGNVASGERRLTVSRPTWRHRSQSTARPTDQDPIDPSGVPPVSRDTPVGNMKCEDGSCEIAPAIQNDPQWKRAFYSNLRSPSPGGQPASDDRNSPPSNQTAAGGPSVPRAIFRDNPYAKVSSKPKTPEPAKQQFDLPNSNSRRRTAMLIGSEPEYAAPPVPTGWTINDGQTETRPVVPNTAGSFPQAFPPPSQTTVPLPFSPQLPPPSIFTNDQRPPAPQNRNVASSPSSTNVWKSTVQRDANQPQTSVGSTLSPDHRMLPVASGNTAEHRTDSILPNANEIQNAGDQWVSRSSTRFPNQYRGLDDAGLPEDANARLVPAVPSADSSSTDFSNRQSRETATDQRLGGQMQTTGFSRRPWQQGYQSANPTPTDRTANLDSPSSLHPSGFPAANIGRASVNGPTKANTQIISTKRFRLNYDINAIDPSGVGKVDLYITQNQGRSWTLWGQDPDHQSPFPVEVKDQGLYGFRVVVHSKDGLVGVGPSSGDDADMWVRVDTQTPLAQITSVPYGRGNEAGRLVINYRVSDDFLTLRPVRLSYSRSPQGPWTIIEDNLRNEGRYLWKVNRSVPDRIFLKLDALDSAGNVGTHRLSQSVDVSGLVPRGTIRGVEPVGQ